MWSPWCARVGKSGHIPFGGIELQRIPLRGRGPPLGVCGVQYGAECLVPDDGCLSFVIVNLVTGIQFFLYDLVRGK